MERSKKPSWKMSGLRLSISLALVVFLMFMVDIQSMQKAEIAIGNLGGFREGDALVLPLSGAIQDRVQLEMHSNSEGTSLRLSAEGHEGENLSRTFALPPGMELARAGWRGDQLVLDLTRD